MPRYFEYKDDKSSKFWEIELHGSSYTVRFGKIGTAGQTQEKPFANEAAAEKEYNKLVDEKVKKGYVEIGSGAAPSNVIQMPVRPAAPHSAKSAQKSASDWEEDDGDEEDDDDDDAPPARKAGAATASRPRSGARRFEFEDDKSSKFWEISLEESSFTVRYGRIGTDGQTQTKDFDSEEKAQKEYEKLVQEKLKKGYEEVEGEEGDGFDEDDDDDSDGDAVCEGDSDSTFAGLDIEEWDQEGGIEDPKGCAFKIGLTYEEDDDEGLKWPDKFATFLEDPKASKVKAIVVGSWGSQSMCEGEGSEPIVEALVSACEQLPSLRAIFIADVESEECEISWIQHSDMSPIFDAYPNLTHFRVRGGQALELGTLKHKKLQSLRLESGGLSTEVVQSVANAELPDLTHLELWLGTDNYGGNYTLDDLQPILSGKAFPKLQYLGLRNSEKSDEIAEAVANAPIVNRIKVLDLSMGTLTDEGAEALLQSPSIRKLMQLNVAHHYMNEDVVARMEALGNVVGLDEVQEAEDDGDEVWRYCQVSE